MTGARGVPFQRPRRDAIVAEEWRQWEHSELRCLPRRLPDWDYNSNLQLHRSIAVDLESIRRDCSLNVTTPLRLTAAYWVLGTALRGTIAMVDVGNGDSVEVAELGGAIPGTELCGTVLLETHLVLAANEQPLGLRPTRAGSILWSDSVEVVLEGDSARFPVAIVPFSEILGVPDRAAWYVSWNPLDLTEPLMGSVQLLVNANHPQVVSAVGAGPGTRSEAIISTIYFEVARSLVRGALQDTEFREDAGSYAAGTVGDAVAKLVHRLFPAETVLSVATLADEQPDYFESVLQAKLDLFRI